MSMKTADKRFFSDADIADIRSRYRVERYVDKALTAKLERRRGADYALPELAVLQQRLSRFVAANLDKPFEILDLKRLPGGGSKEMFSFGLLCDGRRRDLILRMTPGESIVETHRLREFEVIDAMRNSVPVPDVLWVDAEGELMGNAALICGFVTGVAKPTEPVGEKGGVSGIGAGFPPAMREPLFEQFVQHLVSIHQFDWTKATLSSMDVPRAGSAEASEWVLQHWNRVWEEDSFEPHPMITRARTWLRDNMPLTDSIHIVHNDYRNGNFLFDEQAVEITAILDWELAHLGDIHEDLAWVLFEGFTAPDEQGRPLVCGLASRERFIQRYEALSGLRVDPARLHYYTIMNLYKLAVLGSATNARSAVDRQTHLDVMMTFSSGFGYSALAGLQQLLSTTGGA